MPSNGKTSRGSVRQSAKRPAPVPSYMEPLERRELMSADVVLQWNQALLAAVRAERPSVGFLTRDLAIVHTAIYDAVNAVDHTGGVSHGKGRARAGASPVAAAAAAGLFAASALFPADAPLFQATFDASLAEVSDGRGRSDGIAVGRLAA